MSAARFDVAIVGAGPAGSSSAILLARRGYSVALIDRCLFPREKLCGDFLNPVSWPLFERLGVADELLSMEHEKVTAFRISTVSGVEAASGFPSQSGQPAFGLGLRRFYLDDLLLQRAKREGVVIKQGCRVVGIEPEKGEWSIMPGGHSKGTRLRATLLVGADGRNSLVAHRLGLVQPGEDSKKVVAFQLHVRGCKGVGEEVQIHLFPGGYAGLVGLGQGMTNLCFTVGKRCVKRGMSVRALFEDCLYGNPHLRRALDGSEIVGSLRSAYPVYFSPRRSYGSGFLLVGDAARVSEPVTGEGIYFALKSGEFAVETIELAFGKGDFSAPLLSGYETACQKAFAPRRRINRLVRALIYRPSLLTPLVRLSSGTSLPMGSLVRSVCGH